MNSGSYGGELARRAEERQALTRERERLAAERDKIWTAINSQWCAILMAHPIVTRRD